MKKNFVIFLSISLAALLFLAFSPIKKQAKDETFIVVLDAGHGGKDPGKNSKYGYLEKDIALDIVLEVGKILEKEPNIKVVYTRKTDKFIDLFVRGKIANEANADLFVSVHCNAHHTQAYGSETYVMGLHRNKTNFEVAKAENSVIYLEDDYEVNYEGFDINSPESFIGLSIMQEEYLEQSIQLASMIQNKFTKKLKRKDRGVKQAGFIVLHQTVMPSVLVETGFITNKKEGNYLNSKKGQREMANSIAGAIIDYKRSVQQNVGLDVSFEKGDDLEIVDTPTEEEQIVEDVTFKVQIAASANRLEPKAYNFNGLTPISREPFNNMYRYFYGETSDYIQIKKLHEEAKSNGYASSYIVAYKDGQRISVAEALSSSAN